MRCYLNTKAILPRSVNALIGILVACCLASLSYAILVPRAWTAILASIFGILLCNVPKLTSVSCQFLYSLAARIANGSKYLKSVRTQYPFSLFYLSVVASVIVLPVACYYHFHQPHFIAGVANTGLLTNSATLVISILGTFIPFVFAASTFARNRISNLVPSFIEKRCAGIADSVVWAFLGILFLTSITLVLTSKGSSSTDVIHVLILALAFITVALFVRTMLVISNPESLIPYFRYRSERVIKRLFWLQYPYPHIRGATLKRFIHINVIGLYRCSAALDRPPLDVAKDCQDEAIRTAEALIEMIKRGIRDNSALQSSHSLKELEQYASSYYLCRSSCHSTSDAFNLYLTNEFKLLVKQTANECGEKHLDSIAQTIRGIMLSACEFTGDSRFSVRQNGLISSWEDLLTETITQTALLQNTTYIQKLIRALGDVGAALLEKGHDVTVEYGTIPAIENIAVMFAKTQFVYHNIIVNIAMESLLNISLQWTSERSNLRAYRDSHLLSAWEKSFTNVIKTKINNYSPSGISPFAAVTGLCSPSPYRLLSCYFVALHKMRLSSMEENTQRLEEGGNSMSIESLLYRAREMRDSLAIFHKPLVELLKDGVILNNATEWDQYTTTLMNIFWLDMQALNDETGFTDKWIASALNDYECIFATIAQEIISIRTSMNPPSPEYWLDDFSDLCAIPAIGIICVAQQSKAFADSVIAAFFEMLVTLFQDAVKRNNNHECDRLKRYLLLIAAWLTANKLGSNMVATVTDILRAHPINLRSFSPFISSSPLLQCYPNGPLHSEVWYLPPSEYWSTEVQREVNIRLMNRRMLEEFAKLYVSHNENDSIED